MEDINASVGTVDSAWSQFVDSAVLSLVRYHVFFFLVLALIE